METQDFYTLVAKMRMQQEINTRIRNIESLQKQWYAEFLVDTELNRNRREPKTFSVISEMCCPLDGSLCLN